MTFINSYLKTIMSVSVLCSIMNILSPEGQKGKIFKFICGICILLCLVLPLKNGLNFLKRDSFVFDKEEYTIEDAGTYQAKIMENELKSNINSIVKNVLGDSAKDINLTVEYAQDSFKISSIEIVLPYSAKGKKIAVRDSVYNKFGVSPNVIIEREAEYNG